MTEIKQYPRPKLVVMAGFPRSGKTKMSSYLARASGAPRLAFDDFRTMMYDRRYPPDVAKDLDLPSRYSTTPEEENVVQQSTGFLKDILLASGFNAIIDSTANFNAMRAHLFEIRSDIQADKFLFVVQVDPEELRRRLKKHQSEGYTEEAVDLWLSRWEQPDNKGYETIILPNNTPGDYKASLRRAMRVLGKGKD